MENQVTAVPNRIHPLMAGAAASVILVSLLGVAAITGVIPSSHGTVAPAVPVAAADLVQKPYAVTDARIIAPQETIASQQQEVSLVKTAQGERYVTRDGKILEVVPGTQQVAQVQQARIVADATPVPVAHPAATHRHVQQRAHERSQHRSQQYAQNTYAPPAPRSYEEPVYQSQPHPIRNYVSDMHPVGTGVGAVVGGVLGNQVGGGNGKKVATVAGALLGGYAGNEVAHNRNPLAW